MRVNGDISHLLFLFCFFFQAESQHLHKAGIMVQHRCMNECLFKKLQLDSAGATIAFDVRWRENCPFLKRSRLCFGFPPSPLHRPSDAHLPSHHPSVHPSVRLSVWSVSFLLEPRLTETSELCVGLSVNENDPSAS